MAKKEKKSFFKIELKNVSTNWDVIYIPFECSPGYLEDQIIQYTEFGGSVNISVIQMTQKEFEKLPEIND